MCFSLPYKILKIKKNTALIEGGRIVRLGKDLKVGKGDYLQIMGNVAVNSLTKEQGNNVRKLIKSLELVSKPTTLGHSGKPRLNRGASRILR